MKKSLIIILILFVFAGIAFAQNKSFKVFYCQGNAFIITGKQKKAAQRDMLINEGQALKLDKNASIILVATDRTALPVGVAGSYSFKELLHLLDENSRSLSSRYFSYVISEMTEAHEKPEDKLTGGVYRAEKLMRMPYDSCLVIQNNIRFSWVRGVSSELLFLTVWDKNKKNILSKTLRDTTYNYEITHGNTEQPFEWSVGYEPDRSANIAARTFTVASVKTIGRLKTELAELEKNFSFQPEFNELIRLNFYEVNHLYFEEYNAMVEALKKFPDSELLREYYDWFSKKQ